MTTHTHQHLHSDGTPCHCDEPASANEHETVATDPVCGMTVEVAEACHTVEYDGHAYYFCSEACRTTFVANPEHFAQAKTDLHPGGHTHHP